MKKIFFLSQIIAQQSLFFSSCMCFVLFFIIFLLFFLPFASFFLKLGLIILSFSYDYDKKTISQFQSRYLWWLSINQYCLPPKFFCTGLQLETNSFYLIIANWNILFTRPLTTYRVSKLVFCKRVVSMLKIVQILLKRLEYYYWDGNETNLFSLLTNLD